MRVVPSITAAAATVQVPRINRQQQIHGSAGAVVAIAEDAAEMAVVAAVAVAAAKVKLRGPRGAASHLAG